MKLFWFDWGEPLWYLLDILFCTQPNNCVGGAWQMYEEMYILKMQLMAWKHVLEQHLKPSFVSLEQPPGKEDGIGTRLFSEMFLFPICIHAKWIVDIELSQNTIFHCSAPKIRKRDHCWEHFCQKYFIFHFTEWSGLEDLQEVSCQATCSKQVQQWI